MRVGDQLSISVTDLIARSTQKSCRGMQSLSIAFGALLGDIIARAKLDVCLFEVVFYPVCGYQSLQASRAVARMSWRW